MNEFAASNGYRLNVDLGSIIIYNRADDVRHTLGMYSVDALREFFQHERDEELGRWRWPEHREYVVYASRLPILVLNELTGDTLRAHRADGFSDSGHGTIYNAASAYFEAHPEPKPWEDAKPGEVWELTIDDGSEHTVFVHADRTMGGRDGVSAGGAYFDLDDGSNITAAHKVWPESD